MLKMTQHNSVAETSTKVSFLNIKVALLYNNWLTVIPNLHFNFEAVVRTVIDWSSDRVDWFLIEVYIDVKKLLIGLITAPMIDDWPVEQYCELWQWYVVQCLIAQEWYFVWHENESLICDYVIYIYIINNAKFLKRYSFFYLR